MVRGARIRLLVLVLLSARPCLGQVLEQWAEDWQWQKLLHMRDGAFTVDDPDFYHGARNTPLDQLLAFHKAWQKDFHGDHVWCRFPARSLWLAKKLKLPTPQVPKDCNEYWDYMEEIKPETISLVFPSEYFGNPASMFGHTFLRVGARDAPPLLSHALSYGAAIEDQPGLSYAIKGIFGFYPGYFSIAPYYTTVSQYNDMEDRDLWDFPIKLAPEKVRFLMAHLWELKDKTIDYYFFDDNCSLLLLDFLAVADRSINSEDITGLWVFPLDVVYYLRDQDLLHRPRYRPSMSQKISMIGRDIDPSLMDHVDLLEERFFEGDQLPLAPEEQIKLFRFWAERLRLNFREGRMSRPTYASRYLKVLGSQARSSSKPSTLPMLPDYDLLDGHYPKLVAVGGQFGSQPGALLRLRPAMHGADDPSGGFRPGSILSVLDTKILANEQDLLLDELVLFQMASWQEQHSLMATWSWETRAAYERWLELSYLEGAIGQRLFSYEGIHALFLIGGQLRYQTDFEVASLAQLRFRTQITGKWFFNGLAKISWQPGLWESIWQTSIHYQWSAGQGILLSGRGGPFKKEQLSLEYRRYL
ncbi:DUF4105 domain-containing protein [Pseudobacteriovorax antillogorgiicola]|uniref:Uncharacterized protein n=2 Tax=Pseudobacteriovorax antillogorgiicola TaxID=1513793 RepID=A0A1Y6BYJ6_9BACT|nr:DUF4105 domain-containing protein [Pseudobacteriovorax antillogorgiicola]TCS52970.1 uncharacterized protein DUF4105 [Pseudobacteriovorax antillogorgiicola]SMF27451.1 protein of unknown function [Pseudobacteriovorax antillogorgiicola]